MLPLLMGASSNIVRAVQAVTPQAIFVDRRPLRQLESLLREDQDHFFTVDFVDTDALRDFSQVLRGGLRPDAVLSTTEDGLIPAAHLASWLGATGTPLDVVERTRDKVAMRRCLNDHVPSLHWPFARGTDADSVTRILELHTPCIAKPRRGTASRHVRTLNSMVDWQLIDADERAEAIVEKKAHGTEVTVETMSCAGEHTVVAVVEKQTSDNSVELAHICPPPSLLKPDLERVGSAVKSCLTAVGLLDGPSCTEVFVSSDDVVVVETHNRLGGDGLADLVSLTTGVDWRRASVGWPYESLRQASSVGADRAAHAAVVFFTAPPGEVSSVRLEPPNLNGVRFLGWHLDVGVGDHVHALRSSQDRLGVTLIASESADALSEAVDFLLATPVVTTAGTRR